MKRHLLFVTCGNETGDDGLSSAVDVVRTTSRPVVTIARNQLQTA